MAYGQVYEGYDPNGTGGGTGGGNGLGSGISMMLGGMFGNSGRPYDKAMDQYNQSMDRARGSQNPFYNAGQKGLSDYQTWLEGQKDPSKFINDQMKNYNQSEWAKNATQASMRAGTNAASAGGLIGSTPFAQQMQQNAGQIASQDQNNWLQNVLGINTQYGQGQQNVANYGQHAADQLTDIDKSSAPWLAEQQYNKRAARQNDKWNAIGGAGQTAAEAAKMFAGA